MSKDNAYEDNVYIGETAIQIGQHGFFNQPKEIIDYIKYLQNELQQKENIIKEVREKIENTTINCDGVAEDLIDDIYEILDKEVN